MLLLNEAEENGARARVCASAVEDSNQAAHHGPVAVSGEIILDLEDPAFAAVMLICRVPVGDGCIDLLSRWARIADMPHRERDVFHFPVVPPSAETEHDIAELTRQRQAEYERLFSDNGGVGCIAYSPAENVA
jgi:hypothetical protein